MPCYDDGVELTTPRETDGDKVASHATEARIAVYSLERQLKIVKAIAKMSEGLAGLMRIDGGITLNTTVAEILERNRAF
jgi:hypothetical protein